MCKVKLCVLSNNVRNPNRYEMPAFQFQSVLLHSLPHEVIEAAEDYVKLLFNASGNNLIPPEPPPPYRAIAWRYAANYPGSWEVCIKYDWPRPRPDFSSFDIFLVQPTNDE